MTVATASVKVKVSEITGPALAWAVAQCEGYTYFPKDESGSTYVHGETSEWHHSGNYNPVEKWVHGGPILDQMRPHMNPIFYNDAPAWEMWADWDINGNKTCHVYGPTILIAGMRCFVISRMGEEIDVPSELVA